VALKRPEIHSSGRYIDTKNGEVSKSLFLGYTDPADRSSKFLGDVGSHLPSQTASNPTRLESPPTTLPEPHMSQMLSIAQPLSLSIPRSLLGSISNHTNKETTQYLICIWGFRSHTSPTVQNQPCHKRTYVGRMESCNPTIPTASK